MKNNILNKRIAMIDRLLAKRDSDETMTLWDIAKKTDSGILLVNQRRKLMRKANEIEGDPDIQRVKPPRDCVVCEKEHHYICRSGQCLGCAIIAGLHIETSSLEIVTPDRGSKPYDDIESYDDDQWE